MYNDNINLTSQDILDKDFNVDTRGYRPQEVDKFLDLVIKDYTEFNSTIKKLQKDNRLLEDYKKLCSEWDGRECRHGLCF